ncbi:hypothetical protein BpHYR1_008754 [Brachionus plicatilis]|uniref:Uncharacterized protein n=1 Tax=Brachionus plicatilis TaxID=10195 RepID=A0A3M7QJ16_BRAPC|nr:hypothetical protein BpHYR1_008754 [Brachionus plicatilis]
MENLIRLKLHFFLPVELQYFTIILTKTNPLKDHLSSASSPKKVQKFQKTKKKHILMLHLTKAFIQAECISLEKTTVISFLYNLTTSPYYIIIF